MGSNQFTASERTRETSPQIRSPIPNTSFDHKPEGKQSRTHWQNPNHISVYRKIMNFLLSPGTGSTSDRSGVFWKNSSLGVDILLSGKPSTHRLWKESLRPHVASLGNSVSLRSCRNGEFAAGRGLSGPLPAEQMRTAEATCQTLHVVVLF